MSKDGYILLGSHKTPSPGGGAHTFTNIPAGYDSLTIRGNLQGNRNTALTYIQARFNGASAAVYDSWLNYVNENGAVTATWALADNVAFLAATGGAGIGVWPCQVETTFFGVSDPDVYTKWVTVFGYSGGLGGYGAAGCMGGVWKDKSVVSSLSITLNFGLRTDNITNLYGRRT